MKKIGMIGCLAFVLTLQAGAQTKPAVAPKKEVYQAVATKTNDLVHTALDASFDFSNATLSGVKFENCDLSKSIFDATNLEKTDFSTAIHFSIHPENNKLSKTKFSNENLSGLLNKYDLDII